MEQMRSRVLRMLEEVATEEQVHRATRGSNSYQTIHEHAERLAGAYEIPLPRAVAIIAVLSPIITWEENLVDAWGICHELSEPEEVWSRRTYSALPANIEKARRMARGESSAEVMRGQKVWAFFWSILYPHNAFSVCVDRHVGRVALGWRKTWREIDTMLKSPGVYDRVADVYREIAPEVGMLPLELQATAWLVAREGLPKPPEDQHHIEFHED